MLSHIGNILLYLHYALICVDVKYIPYGQSMSIVSTCNFWSTILVYVSYNEEECNCSKCASTNMKINTTDPNLYVFYPSQSCRSYVSTECPVCKTRKRQLCCNRITFALHKEMSLYVNKVQDLYYPTFLCNAYGIVYQLFQQLLRLSNLISHIDYLSWFLSLLDR